MVRCSTRLFLSQFLHQIQNEQILLATSVSLYYFLSSVGFTQHLYGSGNRAVELEKVTFVLIYGSNCCLLYLTSLQSKVGSTETFSFTGTEGVCVCVCLQTGEVQPWGPDHGKHPCHPELPVRGPEQRVQLLCQERERLWDPQSSAEGGRWGRNKGVRLSVWEQKAPLSRFSVLPRPDLCATCRFWRWFLLWNLCRNSGGRFLQHYTSTYYISQGDIVVFTLLHLLNTFSYFADSDY